uniref:RING-CH-type domain-containing protein n=1 Tax=Kalanchoe fedtschenkoi TaxID=63787 RepID=A0A7N0RHC8_KALFE
MSTAHIDLEQGRMSYQQYPRRTTNSGSDDEDSRSICFSDADEGSCYSTFYSTAGGSYEDIRFTDHEVGDGSGSRRDSSVSDCSVKVEIHDEHGDVKVHLDDEVGGESRECRICHLSLGAGSNVIELGCDCKNDLAAAHSNCAERWFKIRGNRTCEICNSVAENVNVVSELELMQQSTGISASTIVTASSLAPPSPTESTRCFWRGHRFLNFLLACMVFAFVVSWLFHFNVPS